jgi:hypothetical protein
MNICTRQTGAPAEGQQKHHVPFHHQGRVQEHVTTLWSRLDDTVNGTEQLAAHRHTNCTRRTLHSRYRHTWARSCGVATTWQASTADMVPRTAKCSSQHPIMRGCTTTGSMLLSSSGRTCCRSCWEQDPGLCYLEGVAPIHSCCWVLKGCSQDIPWGILAVHTT